MLQWISLSIFFLSTSASIPVKLITGNENNVSNDMHSFYFNECWKLQRIYLTFSTILPKQCITKSASLGQNKGATWWDVSHSHFTWQFSYSGVEGLFKYLRVVFSFSSLVCLRLFSIVFDGLFERFTCSNFLYLKLVNI